MECHCCSVSCLELHSTLRDQQRKKHVHPVSFEFLGLHIDLTSVRDDRLSWPQAELVD